MMITDQKIRAVFMDVDGTLINRKTHEVHPADLETIESLYYSGVALFIATGRDLDSSDEQQALNSVDPYMTGYISSNGQHCYLADGTEVSSHGLDPEEFQKVLQLSLEHNFAILYGIGRDRFMSCPTEKAEDFARRSAIPLPAVRPLQPEDLPIQKASIYISKEESEMYLKPILKHTRAAQTSKFMVDLIPENVGKSSGIREMCEFFGFKREETIAFGDGENDIDMLRYAGIGVAMQSAPENVKLSADYVTADPDQAGITQFFTRL